MPFPKFQTPDSIPAAYICRRLLIPDNPLIIAAVNGALNALCDDQNWQPYGAVSTSDIAYEMLLMVDKYFESDCMLGTIAMHPFSSLPDNLIPCDGSVFLRVDYPELYGKLSAHQPALIVDSDTFSTPDMRERFVYGANDPADMFATAGTTEHALTVDEMPSHSHTTQPHGHTAQPHTHTNVPHSHGEVIAVPSAAGGSPVPVPAAVPSAGVTSPAGVIIDAAIVAVDTAVVTVDSAGSGLAHNNMPPYIVLGYAMVAR